MIKALQEMANETPAVREPLSPDVPVLEALPSDAPPPPPLRGPPSPAPWDAPVLAPLPSEAAAAPMSPVFGAANSGAAPIPVDYAPGMPVPPPMFLAGGLAPYPPHYGVPGPYPAFAPMQLPTPPPEDTIYQGTVTNFGFAAKDGTSSRHCYGFIKVDQTHKEVWVGEADAPDGYLSQGDRCEFRIVDARTKNRITGARQWKATDVVCIQRAKVMGPIQKIRAIDRELMNLVEANGGEKVA